MNLYRQVAPGENVISIGEDLMEEGEPLLTEGTKLRSQELGALASQGITEVLCTIEKPIVGYLSTGDEIVPIETKELQIGQARDMNGMTIGSLVFEWGCEFVYGGIVKDQPREIRKKNKRNVGANGLSDSFRWQVQSERRITPLR